jgi:hypothetical protein
MAWQRILCMVGRHDYAFRYAEPGHRYATYHYADGRQATGYGPIRLGWFCTRCQRGAPRRIVNGLPVEIR